MDSSDAEEARLTWTLPGGSPVGPELVRRGGLAPRVARFASDLRRVTDAGDAGRLVERAGRGLWDAAVARAQGRGPAGDLPAGDDRPLYWARLSMARMLRQCAPPFAADGERAGWQRRFEYASRGLTGSGFAPGPRRLLVSGFDPFRLDGELRRGNPSGAAVLALAGRTLEVDGVDVAVRAVVLPVRFADFDDGIVEDAFRPQLPGDLLCTISQGTPGVFRLEVWNGRRRSADLADNRGAPGGGGPERPVVFPGVGPGAEFVRSTLPLEAMAAAGAGAAFPVEVHHRVVELPPGAGVPRVEPRGPSPGSVAVEGSGGGYLSNESAYRVTRLRDEAGLTLPAGHLHTPVVGFAESNEAGLTDPVFEAGRAAVVDQVERILRAGLAAVLQG